jgi:hypothetical protein
MSLKNIYIQNLQDRYNLLLNKIAIVLQKSHGTNTTLSDEVKDELFIKNFKKYQSIFSEFKGLSLEKEITLTNAFAKIETLLDLSKIENNFDFSHHYNLFIKDHYLKQISDVVTEESKHPK